MTQGGPSFCKLEKQGWACKNKTALFKLQKLTKKKPGHNLIAVNDNDEIK